MSDPVAAALLEQVRATRSEALAAMTALSGDTSACALAKDGSSFPAYKFHEGRVAALSRISRTAGADGASPADRLAREAAWWDAQIAQAADRGRGWQAYAAGGREAVAALVEAAG